MTSPSKNLQQVQGAPIEREEKKDTSRNDSNVEDEEFNINMYQLHKKFHKFLDINHPTHSELTYQSSFSAENQIDSEIETAAKETKKRSISKTTKSKYETCLDLDLELKLSPPWSTVYDQNSSKPLKSSSSWISLSASSLSSQGTCISSNMDSDHENNLNGTSKDELLSLIVMGCTRCHLFVMVSKFDPKCPKCKNPNLLDIADDIDNPAKKSKTTPN